MKAAGWSLSLSCARTQKYREKRKGLRQREERKDCHIDLVLLPAVEEGGWVGSAGWMVTQRKQARHVRRENTALPLSW